MVIECLRNRQCPWGKMMNNDVISDWYYTVIMLISCRYSISLPAPWSAVLCCDCGWDSDGGMYVREVFMMMTRWTYSPPATCYLVGRKWFMYPYADGCCWEAIIYNYKQFPLIYNNDNNYHLNYGIMQHERWRINAFDIPTVWDKWALKHQL